MPTTAVTSTTTTTVNLGAGDNYLLAEGITHYVTTANYVVNVGGAGNNDLFVNGAIVQLGEQDTIYFANTPLFNASITIGESGSILGSGNYRTVYSSAFNLTILNNGLIVGGEPLFLNGDNAEVYNTGIIQSNFSTNSGGQPYGITFGGPGAVLHNSGQIDTLGGIYTQEDIQITNTGTINTTGTAVDFFNIVTGASSITNAGQITALNGIAVSASDAIQTIDNSGDISGNIYLAGGNDTVTNTGTIYGDIDGGAGVDVINNTGVISQDLIMDAGADDVFNAGQIMGEIYLGADNDSYLAVGDGVAARTIFGEAGDDTITGGTQADDLDGGADNDVIRGRTGDDTIDGGAGHDTLRAGGGDDFISGDSGADLIRAGSGEDVLIGGLGSDTMFGGADADVFVFGTIADSPDSGDRDVIQDFVAGEDLIDLTGLGVISFIGAAGFSGTGAEVSVSNPNAIGRVKILVDVDGDGTADMKIVLNNTTILSEDDFIL